MATVPTNDQEIADFQRRLEEFGNSLPAKEQALLAQILVYAAESGVDVEGHALSLKEITWPSVRERLGTLLESIVLEFGKTDPNLYGGIWPQTT